MKSNNKGLQMSRMGQGALGPEGRRAADVQSEWGSPHGDSILGEPTPGVVASANPKRESSHCIQTKKEPCGAR